MPDMTIHLPPEMESYRADLEYFMNTMVRKLHVNRHKGDGNSLDPIWMLDRAMVEKTEAIEAINHLGQFEFAVECADIANFAFLAARNAQAMDRGAFDSYRAKKDKPKAPTPAPIVSPQDYMEDMYSRARKKEDERQRTIATGWPGDPNNQARKTE